VRVATHHRFPIALAGVSAACAVLALSTPATAQGRASAVECRKTETQAECHARLKCKADEEVEDCQKRLLRCRAGEDLQACKQRAAAQSRDDRARQDDDDDRDDRDRGDDDDREDRDRGDDDDRGDRDRGDDDDSGDDDDRGDRDDRGRRGRGRGDSRGGDGGRGRRGDGGGNGFQANKTFGLGLELGEPTGLNGKYFFSDKAALDFGVGWIYRHYYYGDGLHIYGDFLYHPVSLASAEAFELPLYIGVGLRFWDFDYCDVNVCDYDGWALGLRVPIGISFDFNNAPVDIFIQLVPVIDIVYGDYYDRYGDRAHAGIDLSFGIRFWFK
jgi:hypothetical protein